MCCRGPSGSATGSGAGVPGIQAPTPIAVCTALSFTTSAAKDWSTGSSETSTCSNQASRRCPSHLRTITQRVELLFGAMVVALLAVLGWIVLQILRQQGRLLVRIEALEALLATKGMAPEADADTSGLSIGAVAPAFGLSGLHGERLTLEALRAPGKPVLLVFSDPSCGPCTALMPEVGRWQRDYAGKLTLTLISRGTAEVNRAKASEHGITHMLLQQDREVAESYQAHGTPTAVLVHPDGIIGSPVASGAEEIRALVAGVVGLPVLRSLPMAARANGNGQAATEKPGELTGLRVGKPAPGFSLQDLTGKTRDVADFRGNKTLVLFWNPGCGFCQRMLDDLKAWEAKPPQGAPKLLVISTGTVETNKAMGLRSPVLLDQGSMSIGSKFGAHGTPMAVLVDAEGRIASEVAAGAPAVLTLAGYEQDTPVSA